MSDVNKLEALENRVSKLEDINNASVEVWRRYYNALAQSKIIYASLPWYKRFFSSPTAYMGEWWK